MGIPIFFNMKKILFPIILFAVGFGIWSCDSEDPSPTFRLNSPPSLTSPSDGQSFVLTEDESENDFETFEWSAMSYSPDNIQNPLYRLQVDFTDNNFSDFSTVSSTADLSTTPTVGDLNTLLLNKLSSLEGEDTTLNVEFRVETSFQNTAINNIFSNSIGIAITIFKPTTATDVSLLNVPGAHQGWDPANDATAIFSRMNDEVYEGYMYFPDDNNEFKYAKGSWDADSNWGDNEADGILDPDGGNIMTETAGMYRLNVDLNEGVLTHEFTRTDWGLIGTVHAGGWDEDENMIYDPVTGNLTITIDLIAGLFKFRANDDWTINLGDNDADSSLEQNGADINLPEDGNYTIELILNDPSQYTYSVTKN